MENVKRNRLSANQPKLALRADKKSATPKTIYPCPENALAQAEKAYDILDGLAKARAAADKEA